MMAKHGRKLLSRKLKRAIADKEQFAFAWGTVESFHLDDCRLRVCQRPGTVNAQTLKMTPSFALDHAPLHFAGRLHDEALSSRRRQHHGLRGRPERDAERSSDRNDNGKQHGSEFPTQRPHRPRPTHQFDGSLIRAPASHVESSASSNCTAMFSAAPSA